ncbi:MAG: hypothetical protein K2X60_03450 [Xanthobacteraceae bacterium]|nr:hypothetical protein [Xanthobacteraceae bacterium]
MIVIDLSPAVVICGRRALTLKEAAYLVRQYAIEHDDLAGWRLTRLLRNADTYRDAVVAEWALRTWVDQSGINRIPLPNRIHLLPVPERDSAPSGNTADETGAPLTF